MYIVCFVYSQQYNYIAVNVGNSTLASDAIPCKSSFAATQISSVYIGTRGSVDALQLPTGEGIVAKLDTVTVMNIRHTLIHICHNTTNIIHYVLHNYRFL